MFTRGLQAEFVCKIRVWLLRPMKMTLPKWFAIQDMLSRVKTENSCPGEVISCGDIRTHFPPKCSKLTINHASTTNHQSPSTTNHHQPLTNHQPPSLNPWVVTGNLCPQPVLRLAFALQALGTRLPFWRSGAPRDGGWTQAVNGVATIREGWYKVGPRS